MLLLEINSRIPLLIKADFNFYAWNNPLSLRLFTINWLRLSCLTLLSHCRSKIFAFSPQQRNEIALSSSDNKQADALHSNLSSWFKSIGYLVGEKLIKSFNSRMQFQIIVIKFHDGCIQITKKSLVSIWIKERRRLGLKNLETERQTKRILRFTHDLASLWSIKIIILCNSLEKTGFCEDFSAFRSRSIEEVLEKPLKMFSCTNGTLSHQ